MSSDVSDVNLDSLYQQILLSEQQVSENSRQLHEVKSSITKAEEKIKSFTEKLERAHAELDEKAQLESELLLQLKLIKKQEEEIKKKKEDLLEHENRLRQEMERANREAAEEKEKFLKAIRAFNSDFNLLNKRDLVFESQIRSEIQTLQSEAEALTKEMERIEQENSQMMALQTEQQSLNAELQGLHSQLADLERELEEAEALTESLKTEKQTAVQKPLTDSTCLSEAMLVLQSTAFSSDFSQDRGDSGRMWQGIQEITNYKTTSSACDSDASLPDALNDALNDTADVKRTLCSVNPRKSAGPDNVAGRVLRECAEQLVDIFTDIFNIFLSSTVVPTCLKTTTIVPVPKKSTVSCLNDYHPLALTPIVMKCFKRLIMRHIKRQLPPSLDPLRFAPRMLPSPQSSIWPSHTWTIRTHTYKCCS
ncbi:hypothetical protein QTP86_009899 [Hemibagrus guttatus]|nr:hypothetical protein QTP86_009899 [Hemibagrus guttatus]